jgi:hypothetical protein
MRYHHLGVPTTTPREGEVGIPGFGVQHVPFDRNPFHIEWMRFGPEAKVPELVRTTPHLAFVVDDLAAAMAGRETLIAPNRPSAGVTVAFIAWEGMPIELMQFDDPADPRAR